MDNVKVFTTERLNALIADTEETLASLKQEMARRQQNRQEYEIDHLESHMQNTEVSLKTIREFIAFLVSDLREKK